MKPLSLKKQVIGISLGLVIAIWAVYAQVHDFSFILLDDGDYVVQNDHVNTGLSLENIKWALTQSHSNNWHPLTWISHMVDCQFFGLNAGPHHLTNVIIHTLNSILLFLVMARVTGGLWPSAMVAAIFALHPTHVESVAWISERKDVLSTFFWILAMGAYCSYAQQPSRKRYGLALLWFLFGLMSKPMVITFPAVLFLLDYWPLNRFGMGASKSKQTLQSVPFKRLLLEKVPFFMLSVLSVPVTLYAQRNAGPSLHDMSFAVRISNALLSYLRYIGKLFWPVDLSILYPHSHTVPATGILLGTILLLLAITVLVLVFGKKYRYLPVGWFWYVGTLLPVIGIIQVGNQAMADRYTYIPFIGLSFILAWGLPTWLRHLPFSHYLVRIGAMVMLVFFTLGTWRQVTLWQHSITLFEHACEVTDHNYLMQDFTARAYRIRGQAPETIAYWQASLASKPEQPTILNELSWMMSTTEDIDLRDPELSLEYARQACQLTGQKNPEMLDTLAAAYAANGYFTNAVDTMVKALSLATTEEQKTVFRQRIKLYQQDTAYTEPLLADEQAYNRFCPLD